MLMREVERFDESDCPLCHYPTPPDLSPEGEFVRFVDYAALRQQLAAEEQASFDLTKSRDEAWTEIKQLRQRVEKLEAYNAALKQVVPSELVDLRATLAQVIGERDAAHELVVRLEKIVAGEALVTSIHYEPGQPLDLMLSHPMVASIAASMADLLDQSKADNYLECGMSTVSGARFTMTIQRAAKKTPHQLRREAEEQLTEARARIKELDGLALHNKIR